MTRKEELFAYYVSVKDRAVTVWTVSFIKMPTGETEVYISIHKHRSVRWHITTRPMMMNLFIRAVSRSVLRIMPSSELH